MAIDNMQGKVSTTGMMNQGPSVPKAPNLTSLGKKETASAQKQITPPASAETTNPLKEQFPKASETELMFAERAKSLTDEDQAALQAVLSPSVKNALGKIIPEFKPVMDQFGSNEPNVVLPVSVVSNYAKKRYGGNDNEALAAFMEDVSGQMETQQTNVPPGNEPQGLMTSPQNMETV